MISIKSEVFLGPYRIIYHIKADQIDIIAEVHGAMTVLHDEEE
jgi:toxin ParE1/3/4